MQTLSLKERLRRREPVLAPGVYDALSALLAEQAGFEALYLSGGAVAYTLLGRSDVGLTTATETADVLARQHAAHGARLTCCWAMSPRCSRCCRPAGSRDWASAA
ncbi:isocitrate lyase/phosphoenolpyruvate mutase family protein [Cupriavidus necator]|uniref:isocitrate lyase/phosphoenolpyruvate mutase family protein n=1 Tax=Cupriavidus necator TaxID=106590 RepID=UPI0038B3036C